MTTDPAPIIAHLPTLNGAIKVQFAPTEAPSSIFTPTCSLKAHGVDGFLASLITSEISDLARAVAMIQEVADSQESDEAKILGFHFEGPCLAHERRGVHSPSLLRNPEPSLISELLDFPNVKMITLAPELPGGPENLHQLFYSLSHPIVSL